MSQIPTPFPPANHAQTLLYTVAHFDAAFSLFGPMFFPDSLRPLPTLHIFLVQA